MKDVNSMLYDDSINSTISDMNSPEKIARTCVKENQGRKFKFGNESNYLQPYAIGEPDFKKDVSRKKTTNLYRINESKNN